MGVFCLRHSLLFFFFFFFLDVSLTRKLHHFRIGSIFGFSLTKISYQVFITVQCFFVFLKIRKFSVVEKGQVCQSPRKQRAALPFWTLKAFFFFFFFFFFFAE